MLCQNKQLGYRGSEACAQIKRHNACGAAMITEVVVVGVPARDTRASSKLWTCNRKQLHHLRDWTITQTHAQWPAQYQRCVPGSIYSIVATPLSFKRSFIQCGEFLVPASTPRPTSANRSASDLLMPPQHRTTLSPRLPLDHAPAMPIPPPTRSARPRRSYPGSASPCGRR